MPTRLLLPITAFLILTFVSLNTFDLSTPVNLTRYYAGMAQILPSTVQGIVVFSVMSSSA